MTDTTATLSVRAAIAKAVYHAFAVHGLAGFKATTMCNSRLRAALKGEAQHGA